MLERVKSNLGITGTFQDATIQGYIDEVKQFLLDGGVDESVVEAETSIGIITRGVADLWNYGSGGTELSPYFLQRATQLSYIKAKEKPFSVLNFIKNYFYEIEYEDIDYEYAYKYFKEKQPIVNDFCSSVRNGNWYGRNLDWTYDENAEFLVRTPNIKNRYATIGFASGISGLTNEIVKSKSYNDLYKIVPFMLADGINEHGVVANTNVVPLDKGTTTKTIPKVSEELEICSLMLVRYILDHFASAKQAVEYIENYVSVYMPTGLLNMNYETHLMVADENETYLIEFYGNETVVTKLDKPYMTNFYLSDVSFNEDGKVYTPADEHKPSENNISDYGSGLERYNLIVENYNNANSKAGMRDLMNKLKYTNAYKGAEWYTEFVGINGLTVDSEADDFTSVMEQAATAYQNRVRNGETWHTVHSSVYDIANKKVSVIVQEDGLELEYSLVPEYITELEERVNNLERRVDEHDELFEELAGENDD